MELSIGIPAYNEDKWIGKTLEEIGQYLEEKQIDWEIIVVDDGSADSTIEVVRGSKGVRLLCNERNMGKGYSVRRGVLAAEGNYIIIIDADLPFPISELEKVLNVLKEGWDIAIGSKYLQKSEKITDVPWYRLYGGRLFNLLARLLLIRGIRDTQCGLKVFKQKVAKDLFTRQRVNGFAFDVEVLYLAQSMGYKIKELPVKWKYVFKERGCSFLLRGLSMVLDLFRIKFMKYDV